MIKYATETLNYIAVKVKSVQLLPFYPKYLT